MMLKLEWLILQNLLNVRVAKGVTSDPHDFIADTNVVLNPFVTALQLKRAFFSAVIVQLSSLLKSQYIYIRTVSSELLLSM
jgi:hypothetical protein